MPTEKFDKLKDQIKSIKSTGLLTKRKHKIALCLAGGGITGSMYEVGCLTAMDDFFEPPSCVNQFDIFVGTSAGAIISALIANGYQPRELFEGITQDSDTGFNFRKKNIYTLKWGEIFKAFVPLFKRFFSLVKYGWKNRKQASLMDLFSIMQEFMPPGIFSLSNLDKFVAGLCYPEGKTNDFRNLEKELYITATDLDSGQRCVFGEENTNDVPISKAVAASAAIPVFFRPFNINGREFIDGSTSKVSHIDVALKHGARLIIVINPTVPFENDLSMVCLPTFDGECARLSQKGMGFISDQARRIETKTRFDLGFERFKNDHPEVDFLVIQPKSSDSLLFIRSVMDFESRKIVLNYGYNSTMNFLEENFETVQAVFEKHGIKINSDRLKNKLESQQKA
ncbi:MAG: patatin-like phospholipase family protein [bacterium]